MKTLLSSISVLFIIVLALSACNPVEPVKALQSELAREANPDVSAEDTAAIANGNNDFGWDLFHQLQSESGNLFYSPYSISSALAMTWAGARGDTEAQMAQALHFNLDQAGLHRAFNALIQTLDSRAEAEGIEPDKAFKLHIANALWGQQGFNFLPSFLDTLAMNYGAGMYLVDFQANPEGARKDINDWVSRETEERIKDIVPEGAIDTLTRLVLSNAIYFKADWAREFEGSWTESQEFHLADGTKVNIPTMFQRASFRYASGGGLQALELPYTGDELSMVILLPNEGQLESVQDAINSTSLDALLSQLDYREVNLSLPKFKYDYSLGLADTLKYLGMLDAFNPAAADFSGMDGARDLYVSNILHKAFVAVDEAGTEAAAATVVIVGTTSAPAGEPLDFRVDRPFLFIIRDIPTNTILFIGRVTNPAN